MSMMTSQILKFVGFTKTPEFVLQLNNLITCQELFCGKKYFCWGGTLQGNYKMLYFQVVFDVAFWSLPVK